MFSSAIFGVLTNPSLERMRTYIPYPIYAGLVAAFFAVPCVVLQLVPHFPTGDPGAASSLSGVLLSVPVISFLAIATLSTLLSFGGWISGYRPFRKCWTHLSDEELSAAALRLRATAEAAGYRIAWSGAGGDFVGVSGMALEGNAALHSGSHFPVRVCLRTRRRASRGEADLRLENRTVVLWDTGERARLAELGAALIAGANLPE